MAHFLDHIGPAMESWWADLGHAELTPELRQKLIAGWDEERAGRGVAELAAQRDKRLLALIEMLRATEKAGR